jgi:cystathionine beta-lyase
LSGHSRAGSDRPGHATHQVQRTPSRHQHSITPGARAGLAFNAFTLGADISVQALTKYPSGGATVLMGSLVTGTTKRCTSWCISAICAWATAASGGNDAELVLRGLNSASPTAMPRKMPPRASCHLVHGKAAADSRRAAPGCLIQAMPDGLPGAACLFSAVFEAKFTALRRSTGLRQPATFQA